MVQLEFILKELITNIHNPPLEPCFEPIKEHNDNIKYSTFSKKRFYYYIYTCIEKVQNTSLILNLFLILRDHSYVFDNNIRKKIIKFERNIEKLPIKTFKKISINNSIYHISSYEKIRDDNIIYNISSCHSIDEFWGIKAVRKIIQQTTNELLTYLKKPRKLTKNFGDYNTELLFDILGLTPLQQKFILLKLDSVNTCLDNIIYITHKQKGYINCIFDFFFKPKELKKTEQQSSTKLSLFDDQQTIINILYTRKYKNKEDLISNFCSVIKHSKLNFDDFYFIRQKDFILNVLKNSIKNNKKGINILLYGKPGTGKTEFAKSLINELGYIGYNIDNNRIDTDNISITSETKLLNFDKDSEFRKATLLITNEFLKNTKSIILFDEAEDFFRNNTLQLNNQSKYMVNELLENNNVPIIWTTNDIHCMEESYLRRFNYVLELSDLPQKHLEKIINDLANKHKIDLNQKTKNIILTRRPKIGIIDKVFETYKLSGSKKSEELSLLLNDMINNTSFNHNTKRIKINKSDFLPELLNTNEDLTTLSDTIVNSGRLDFSILSYGCSGASKTSFARHLAEKLGIEVIYKNYSELSSCLVGETEKEIEKLFDEATKLKAMIILDEADVLLQDRNKANRSWEISQTEALLTAMEDHEYPFIMTTNLFDNIDSAVMRRFDFKIKHDYMNEEQVKIALKHFFDIDYKGNTGLRQLTPGDCVSVKKQIRFLPNILEKEILEKLELECKNKKDYQKVIGF